MGKFMLPQRAGGWRRSTGNGGRWGGRQWLMRLGLLLGMAIAVIGLGAIAASTPSNYDILQKAPFNQPDFYPLQQRQPPRNYRAVGEWTGRLILPPESDAQDWVWLRVENAPSAQRQLIGQTVKLTWQAAAGVQRYVDTVTRDVNLTPTVAASQQSGNVHPTRLDGRAQVGPLRSLAGARPHDDVTVLLEAVQVQSENGQPVLQIAQEPVLITGRYYGLVQILGPEPTAPQATRPPDCPGEPPCPRDRYRVQHYNPQTQKFDGPLEVVRFPQQPKGRGDLFQSTPRGIEQSPAGADGWYIYGAPDKTRQFVVQAIVPRSLLRLQPDRILLGPDPSLDYLTQHTWADLANQQGTVKTALLAPASPSEAAALENWPLGKVAIVLHLFGGIGGAKAEDQAVPQTISGHFSYGFATVKRDPFTQELQFDVRYYQVYTHNPNGIIAGIHTWADYMGNLQWGWLGLRPVSDVLASLPMVTEDYPFGDLTLSPLTDFRRALQVMMARYRVGDGTGGATVTPATSCVQDSNQALYATIREVQQQVQANPAIQDWLRQHPDDPQTQRFQELVALGTALEAQLEPLGIVREDWDRNADAIVGTDPDRAFANDDGPFAGLTTWRTMLPRQAQDELSILFLQQGQPLWLWRTTQVGGVDPAIAPLAPTALFGQLTLPGTDYPLVSVVLGRLLGAIRPMAARDWLVVVVMLFGYGAIALPLGVSRRFLVWQPWFTHWRGYLRLMGVALISPALLEELGFRVLLLPHPLEGVTRSTWLLWALVSLVLFVLYHPLQAKTIHQAGDPTFFDPTFLMLAALLGVACTVTYALTGSWWAIAIVHWVPVVAWLLGFGGLARLHHSPPLPPRPAKPDAA